MEELLLLLQIGIVILIKMLKIVNPIGHLLEYIWLLKKKLKFFYKIDDSLSGISVGVNFRYINEYRIGNGSILYRDLYKIYGIQFIFLTSGKNLTIKT